MTTTTKGAAMWRCCRSTIRRSTVSDTLTRKGLIDGLGRALHDEDVQAIVITGTGKVFSGGADIKEFNTPAALAEPTCCK